MREVPLRDSVLASMPATVSVADAARILRISRSGVYALVHRFEESGGADGLAVVHMAGGRLRVPTSVLVALMGGA